MIMKECFGILRNYRCNFVRTFFCVADNLMTYFDLKKPSFSPFYVGWDVTFRCNLKCSFCQTHRFITEDKELTTEECLGIIKQLGRAKVSILSITGGEPLLRDDIFILLKALKKENIPVNLNTNGLLLERNMDGIINSSLSALSISILDDTNGGPEGKKLAPLQEEVIKKIISKRRGGRPRIIGVFTLSKKNMSSMNDSINYWERRTDQILLQPVHHSETSIFRCANATDLFPHDSVGAFRREFNALLKKHTQLQTEYMREFPDFFFNRSTLKKRYPCFAGSFMLQIDAYGDMYPCPEFVKNLGSLRHDDFAGILNNRKTKEFRELVRKRKNECFCWYRCTGLINCYMKKLFRPSFNRIGIMGLI